MCYCCYYYLAGVSAVYKERTLVQRLGLPIKVVFLIIGVDLGAAQARAPIIEKRICFHRLL